MTHGGLEVLWDDELRTEREPAKEPAKRWFNWWRPKHGIAWTDGLVGPRRAEPVHPSKDAAETYAAKIERKYCGLVEYLGAFPEGEQPNNT